jgi:hypothetical protein
VQRLHGQQPGQQLRLAGQGTEGHRDGHAMIRAVDDGDRITGAHLPRCDHPQVRSWRAPDREALDPVPLEVIYTFNLLDSAGTGPLVGHGPGHHRGGGRPARAVRDDGRRRIDVLLAWHCRSRIRARRLMP